MIKKFPFLSLGEHQFSRHFESFWPGEVLILPELVLEFQELLAREGGSRSSGLVSHTLSGSGY